jgi:gamma-glutamyltranspeptidase/glutathione hydrolase
MGHRFHVLSRPVNHVAAIMIGAPTLKGKPVANNRYYGANDSRGRTGLALGY